MKRIATTGYSQSLVKLGLTADEARCYVLLLSRGSLIANDIAREIHIFPNAVYRLMKRLEEKHFVVTLDSSPTAFQAIPAFIAIDAFVQKQEQTLEELKVSSLQAIAGKTHKAPQTQIDIVTGRQKMFSTYIELLKHAKEEVFIISVGEAVPDELKIANRDALERGVDIKFIAHQCNEKNKELLRSWVRMGIEVRHFPDSGFHLVVFDRKLSILTSNNPKNVAERTNMVIHSEGLSKALAEYFSTIWGKAVPVMV